MIYVRYVGILRASPVSFPQWSVLHQQVIIAIHEECVGSDDARHQELHNQHKLVRPQCSKNTRYYSTTFFLIPLLGLIYTYLFSCQELEKLIPPSYSSVKYETTSQEMVNFLGWESCSFWSLVVTVRLPRLLCWMARKRNTIPKMSNNAF